MPSTYTAPACRVSRSFEINRSATKFRRSWQIEERWSGWILSRADLKIVSVMDLPMTINSAYGTAEARR